MLSVYTGKLRDEVATIKKALVTHDEVRSRVYPAAPPVADPLAALAAMAPPLLSWRIYDHCAAFTRLYAVYEHFVFDVVAEWLRLLPELYSQYGDLPEAVRKGHRTGVAAVLSKLGGDRYKHVSEEGAISGIYNGLTAKEPYELLFDAFVIDDQNLRHDILNGLLARVGIADGWSWINGHNGIKRFLEEVRGNASTAESELRNFIQHRNDAAHGEVVEVIATEEINKVADFVQILGEAIAELILLQIMRRRMAIGKATQIGTVIRKFSDRVIGAEMTAGPLAVGDEIVIVRDSACYKVIVETIEVENVRHERLEIPSAQNVGMGLTRSAKEGAAIVRLQG